jgi:riboflavin synthase
MELKDFVVDPKNYIFICGSMVAFRVKFEEGREMGISRFQYSGDRRLEKIAAIYTKEGKTVVQVATKSFIIEIDWTEEAVDQKYYEVAKNITDIQDLQFNSRMIML